ncbi:MAG TPA: sugar phosphate isomerase/epimerase family protein [Candidatus Latescibacteria bacterium]|jgi:sugar phosphate isomerase/epimerase|nr:hypothetical protein [Gemmatimonadaceae bacterium]HJP30985.1 sugar phosphate isomerase/epimerase family protein [Candidatus Latescibacterota bacterium]
MTTQTPQQLGVCSWSMLPQNADDMARIMGELGLKKLQLGLVPHRDDAGIVDGVPEALEKVGARVVSGMFGTIGEDYTTMETIKVTGGIVPDEHWEANQEVARGAAARAKRFGLPAVMFHAGFLPHDMASAEFQKLAGRIEAVAGIFGEQGLDMMFETGQETADDLWAFFDHMEERGVSNIGVNFDPANMILYDKGEPIEALRKLLPRVKSIHIKDAVRTTTPGDWGAEVPVGEGQVDWHAFLSVLSEGGYTGDMHIEREGGDDRMGDAKQAIDVLTRVMAEVG